MRARQGTAAVPGVARLEKFFSPRRVKGSRTRNQALPGSGKLGFAAVLPCVRSSFEKLSSGESGLKWNQVLRAWGSFPSGESRNAVPGGGSGRGQAPSRGWRGIRRCPAWGSFHSGRSGKRQWFRAWSSVEKFFGQASQGSREQNQALSSSGKPGGAAAAPGAVMGSFIQWVRIGGSGIEALSSLGKFSPGRSGFCRAARSFHSEAGLVGCRIKRCRDLGKFSFRRGGCCAAGLALGRCTFQLSNGKIVAREPAVVGF